MKRVFALAGFACCLMAASHADYLTAKRKFEAIEKYQTKPGARIPLTLNELNAYVQTEIKEVAPQGFRDPRVELPGNNIAVGHAFINFLKLQRANSAPPNWLIKKMLDG